MNKATVEDFFAGNYQAFYGGYLPGLRKVNSDEMMTLCPFHEGPESFTVRE